jgi:predicted Fe-Mo cluster-binding NifX family protein
MLKVAFACLDERIAPVFDTALQVRVLETESGRIISEKKEMLPPDLPLQKTIRLNELGIQAIVCGAISRPLNAMIAANGIRVIPFVAGDLHAVIQAWLKGGLNGKAFAMPGCCRRARIVDNGFITLIKEKTTMNGRGQGGMGGGRGQGGMGGGQGQGRGMGQGRGGQGRGRMSGPLAGGAIGTCVCPKCGERMAHERGLPCVQRQCPKCGTAMIRE